LGAQFNQGTRARDWKQTWVKAATYIPDDSRNDFYASWMAYLAWNDRKDAGLAAQYLERCLKLTPVLPTRWRDLVAQEAGVFNAWFRTDPNLAEKWFLHVKKRRSLLPVLQARIDVASSCARCDFNSALDAWDKGFKLIQQMPRKPATDTLKEGWLEWRTEIQQRQVQLVTI
jgi:hypothetical protein